MVCISIYGGLAYAKNVSIMSGLIGSKVPISTTKLDSEKYNAEARLVAFSNPIANSSSKSDKKLDLTFLSSKFNDFLNCDIRLKFDQTQSVLIEEVHEQQHVLTLPNSSHLVFSSENVSVFQETWAILKVKGQFERLPIFELIVPLKDTSYGFDIYALGIRSNTNLVRKVLEEKWGVRFSKASAEGRMKQVYFLNGSLLRLMSPGFKSKKTYIQCDHTFKGE